VIIARRPSTDRRPHEPLRDSARTTLAAEQARAYGELRGHGLLYQFTGAWPRTHWARELTRDSDIETSSVTDGNTRGEPWCDRVYFTLARLRDAGAPGDVIGLVERYDPPTQVVIATEYRPHQLACVRISNSERPGEHSAWPFLRFKANIAAACACSGVSPT
jgi:hypothetical protein